MCNSYTCQGNVERWERFNGRKETEECPRERKEGQRVRELPDRNVGGGGD